MILNNMIEVIIDTERLDSRNYNKNEINQLNVKVYRMQDAHLMKLKLEQFIEKHYASIELKEKQYIFIKPFKTSTRFSYSLQGVTDKKLKSLLRYYLNIK